MVVNGCVNAKLDEAKYSSAVPAIGLYIAAGTLVCLGLMLYDIISAFRQKLRWIPCRVFSLNSVTLSLLAICSKLTVDLTTSMPGVEDQISKLTGTVLVCILMGFLNPSIGDSSGSESLSNIGALSIMVITIIVNICIQISTGVIYLFIVEHIIIMCFMVLLLLSLWSCAWDVHIWKEVSLELTKHFIKDGDGSLLKRLKYCYIHGFRSNPQLSISLEATNVTTGGFCLVCFGVLAEASLRSIIMNQLKFCGGVSDYDWTIWIIVFIQILTIAVGCFATTFRWFTMLYPGYYTSTRFWEKDYLIQTNPILGARPADICKSYLTRLFGYLTRHLARFITVFSSFFFTPGLCTLRDYRNDEAIQDYKHLIRDAEGDEKPEINLNVWTVWKAANDMNKWMKVSQSQPLIYLPKFLSKTNPSQLLHNMQIKDITCPDDTCFEVSSLTITLLVRIASFSLPNYTKFLEDSFREAYEILDYVQTRINRSSLTNKNISKLTNALLRGNSLDFFLPKIIERSCGQFHSLSELGRARLIINELENTMDPDILSDEVGQITSLLKMGKYDTIKDLYNYVQQLYVDMLHLFLIEFPNVVFKDVNESPAEEFEKRTRTALILLCKIAPLESHIGWSFPLGRNITSLINGTQKEDKIFRLM